MKLVIWFTDSISKNSIGIFNSAINSLDNLYGNVDIVGVIADNPKTIRLGGVKIIDKQDLKHPNYDLILVAGNNASLVPILQQTDELGIDSDKIVLDRTVCVPNFTMKKYNHLRHSRLSILSSNCFAGLLYHELGLPFLSPTINMFTSDSEFVTFLENPMQNVMQKPVFLRTKYQTVLHFNYPVYKIGGAEWHMNHYSDFDSALQKWHERCNKINWLNVLAVMYTDKPEILAKFDKLPFAKKVCYVPFESELESAYSVNPARYPELSLWQIVTESAQFHIVNYDVWDMLLYGKKTPLNISR